MCEFIAKTLQHRYLSCTSKAFLPRSTKLQVLSQVLKPKRKTTPRERVDIAQTFISFRKTPSLLLTSISAFPFPSAWKLLLQPFAWLASYLFVLSFVSPPERGTS